MSPNPEENMETADQPSYHFVGEDDNGNEIYSVDTDS